MRDAWVGRFLTTDGHGWTRIREVMLSFSFSKHTSYPCSSVQSVVEILRFGMLGWGDFLTTDGHGLTQIRGRRGL